MMRNFKHFATYCSIKVDFEESQIQLRFCVKPNVDAELDQSKFIKSHISKTKCILFFLILSLSPFLSTFSHPLYDTYQKDVCFMVFQT